MKAEGVNEKQRMAHWKQRKTENTKTEITYERLQVLAVVLTLMQIKVFWDITPCTMVVTKISRKYTEDEGTPPKLCNYLPIDMAS